MRFSTSDSPNFKSTENAGFYRNIGDEHVYGRFDLKRLRIISISQKLNED